MSIVMGIDPGSLVTGYSFLESSSSGVRVLEYGALRPPPKAELMERLGFIAARLDALLVQYKPQAVSLESIFFARNARSALILGHARGAILATCHRHTVEMAEFSPREVKQAVSGRGGASKDVVAALMQRHLQLRELPTPSDAADALALAWTYLQRPALSGIPRPARGRSSASRQRAALLQLIQNATSTPQNP